jgi:hypothetical protein
MRMKILAQSRRAGSARLLFRLGMTSLLALGAAFSVQAWKEWQHDADNPIQARCYRVERSGDGYHLRRVGGVTIYSDQQAAMVCNIVHYACRRGRCIACAYDYDRYEDICVDMAGRRFVKP